MMQEKVWQENFILTLEELSNISKQREAWLEKKDSLDSPTEIICQLFDDSGVNDKLEDQDALIFSDHIDSQLLKLSNMVDKIDLDTEPESLLKDVNWIAITKQANLILMLVRDQKE